METCAIMELEARKVQEKQYASDSKEQVCLSNVTQDIENTFIDKGMRNRMQSKHRSLQFYKLVAREGGGKAPL